MFSKQYLKLGFTALLLFAALVAGGCGSYPIKIYTPTPEDTRDLSREQARKLLPNALQSENRCVGPKSVRLTSEKLSVSCKQMRLGYESLDKKARVYRFADNPILLLEGTDFSSAGILSCVKPHPTDRGCYFLWSSRRGSSDYSDAHDFVRAWYVLAHTSTVGPAPETAFERAAQSYRNASVKPQLPEEAVRYKVKAEAAVRQKRFDDAADLYEQALGIVPWWPQGHYNRGLILGEVGDFEEAAIELKRYLKLEPDASNARAVQLKIYEWESSESK